MDPAAGLPTGLNFAECPVHRTLRNLQEGAQPRTQLDPIGIAQGDHQGLPASNQGHEPLLYVVLKVDDQVPLLGLKLEVHAPRAGLALVIAAMKTKNLAATKLMLRPGCIEQGQILGARNTKYGVLARVHKLGVKAEQVVERESWKVERFGHARGAILSGHLNSAETLRLAQTNAGAGTAVA